MARLTERLNVPIERDTKAWYRQQANALGVRSAAQLARIALRQVAAGTVQINFTPNGEISNEAEKMAG